MRRHQAHAQPDIAAYLKPLRTDDRGIGVAIQELIAQCLGASAGLPGKLRFDDGESIGQGAHRAWLLPRIAQRRRQMAADWQSVRACRPGLG